MKLNEEVSVEGQTQETFSEQYPTLLISKSQGSSVGPTYERLKEFASRPHLSVEAGFDIARTL
jgi:hypothetical protein